ncbi:MAG: YdcF family protein [Bacteroidia bacterium]
MLSPLVWVFILFVLSFLRRFNERAFKLRIIALSILFLSSNSFVIDELFRLYEPITEDIDLDTAKYDAAIVLGGIGDVDLRLNKINFTYSADRLFQSIRLLKQGKVKRLIFTGGSGSIEFPEKIEGLYVYKYLIEIGIPDSVLSIEYKSKNTYENAIFTKPIVDSLFPDGKNILVTSAYHMPRAMSVFEKAGYKNLYPYQTNKHSGIRRFTFDHLFIPSVDALFKLHILIHEFVGYAVYKTKGYA